MIDHAFGRNNAWKMLNDYTVTVITDAKVFEEGKLYVPDELIDFFGIEYSEKRVECLYEGREYPTYLEQSPGGGNVTLSWSKALTGKFFSLFPDYENFFNTVNEYNQDETPVIYLEKLEEDSFLVKLMLPTDESLTLKQHLFDFLGPGKSIANFKNSYELVFFKHYLENVDNLWRADVFMVAAQVQKFYTARVNEGKEQDKNADILIENVATVGLDDVLSFLMENPYMTFADQGLMAMETVDDHFYFTVDTALVYELSTDERRLMIEMVDEKIEFYFARFDGPGLQENLQQLMDQYQSYFTRDFRYSFKDVILNSIPATISGLKSVPTARYKVTGFAGVDDWALVPYISIMNKEITRLPNVGVSVQYLLNKDTRTLYLALAYGFKDADAQARKNGLDNERTIAVAVEGAIEPFVTEIRDGLRIGDFATDLEDVELPAPSHTASMICYRKYENAVPGDDKLEADLNAMMEIYEAYYQKFILKENPYPEDDTEEESEEAMEVEPEVLNEEIEGEESEDQVSDDEEDIEDEEDEADDEEEEDDVEEEEEDTVEEEESSQEKESEETVSAFLSDVISITQEVSGIPVPEKEQTEAVSEVPTEEDKPKAAPKKKKKKKATPAPADDVMPALMPSAAAPTPVIVQAPTAPLLDEGALEILKGLFNELAATNAKPPLMKRNREEKREEEVQTVTNVDTALKQIRSYMNFYGVDCDDTMVQNLYLSIKAGPLVLISGGEGAGKSRFVRLFAEAMGVTADNGRYKQIAVSTNWKDADPLLGHLEGSDCYIPGAMVDFVADAVDNPGLPYILCLDEMGLADIEGYFAEVLSLLETRRLKSGVVYTDPLIDDSRFGRDENARAYYGDLYLPDNLTIIGTFSLADAGSHVRRKVLDKAQVMELTASGLQPGDVPTAVQEAMSYDGAFLERDALILSHVDHHREMLQEVITLLEAINGILASAYVSFGYQVRDKICFYLLCNAEYGLMTKEKALDHAIEQNVLPCIMGNTPSVESVMTDLFKICAGTVEDSAIRHYPGGGLFPVTAEKLSKMIVRYDAGKSDLFWC